MNTKQYKTTRAGAALEIEWTGDATFTVRTLDTYHEPTWEARCRVSPQHAGGWTWDGNPGASAMSDDEIDALVVDSTSAVATWLILRAAIGASR